MDRTVQNHGGGGHVSGEEWWIDYLEEELGDGLNDGSVLLQHSKMNHEILKNLQMTKLALKVLDPVRVPEDPAYHARICDRIMTEIQVMDIHTHSPRWWPQSDTETEGDANTEIDDL
jgi:hypothetical protein